MAVFDRRPIRRVQLALHGRGARRLSLRQHEAIAGYLIILPWILGYVIFRLGPVLASGVLAFTDWNALTPPRWAGLGNLRRLFTDPLVVQSLWNTAFYTVFAVPLELGAALFAALLLNVGVRGTNAYRALLYFPSRMPIVASSILWYYIFSPSYGMANTVLAWFNLPAQRWLWDINLVKPSLIIMAAWSLGNSMVIFLAGLQGIPEAPYEAARIDGAGAWSLFRHITLPMLSPTIFFNLVMGIIGSFQVFTNVQVMTQGGPGNYSLMLVLYLYRNGFEYYRMGYASLLAWVLLIIVLLLTILQFQVAGRWVYYEGEVR